jgi:hypothetical protein
MAHAGQIGVNVMVLMLSCPALLPAHAISGVC